MAARLKERYQKDIAPQIAKEFGIDNPMAVPRIEKVVINMGMGEAIANAKILDTAADELRAITGQKPVITKAKKSIASFKLRQGMPIGVVVTLRGDRMYEFLDRLVSVALPRVRDFRGVSPKAFDGRGNYTIGIREQLIFPEIVDVGTSWITTSTPVRSSLTPSVTVAAALMSMAAGWNTGA